MPTYTWVIQPFQYPEPAADLFMAALRKYEQEVISLPNLFWHDIIDLRVGDRYPSTLIPFGSTSFAHWAINRGWYGHWDPHYRYEHLRRLGDDFINHGMQVWPLGRLQLRNSSSKVFVKPASGWNTIKGRMVDPYEWEDHLGQFLSRGMANRLNEQDWTPVNLDTPFCVAPEKQISEEYRCWIINGRVVTSSLYLQGRELTEINSDDNTEVNTFAEQMADKLRYLHLFASPNYVLDIFVTDRGLRVGEINCLHCSGWYAINPEKVVEALLA